uniref:Uncharacterized protein n=1 Tax=Oryza meridionalis TaxID=40149 RepID=A0A0E0E0Q2_9ORYZ
MAETVLSMARSLVGSAISKAASAAANETSLLLGVEKDICSYVPTSRYLPALLAHAPSNHTVTDQLPTAADFCLICHRRPSPSYHRGNCRGS